MHEILKRLPRSARVLDLGCASGSFDTGAYTFQTIRVDAEPQRAGVIQADAAALPFPAESFDAIVSNHSLEHFADLERCLGEIGRVLKPGGALFVAVPDASTFTDRLYRWLARGGGHLNAFTSAEDLARRVEWATGLECRGIRLLHTSLSFLNPRNRKTRAPRKLLLLANGWEPILMVLTYALRVADRWFGTRLSVYGWALYFGGCTVETAAWTNVCVRCGSGHPAAQLRPGLFLYRCPACGARNLYTRDKPYSTGSPLSL